MSWTDEEIQAVWNKGHIVEGKDPDQIRKDDCGAWMRRTEHGDRKSIYGWEIDHINPDGGDDLSNLRPLQWKNNTSKQDGKLTCPVTANGDNNVDSSP